MGILYIYGLLYEEFIDINTLSIHSSSTFAAHAMLKEGSIGLSQKQQFDIGFRYHLHIMHYKSI